jgi:hypothetical protein
MQTEHRLYEEAAPPGFRVELESQVNLLVSLGIVLLLLVAIVALFNALPTYQWSGCTYIGSALR